MVSANQKPPPRRIRVSRFSDSGALRIFVEGNAVRLNVVEGSIPL
jgi:hypothetical protein